MRYFEHIPVQNIPTEHPVAVFNLIWRTLEKNNSPVRWGEVKPVEDGGDPVFSETTLPMPDKDTKEVYRGVFGFSSDGLSVDRIGVVVAPKS